MGLSQAWGKRDDIQRKREITLRFRQLWGSVSITSTEVFKNWSLIWSEMSSQLLQEKICPSHPPSCPCLGCFNSPRCSRLECYHRLMSWPSRLLERVSKLRQVTSEMSLGTETYFPGIPVLTPLTLQSLSRSSQDLLWRGVKTKWPFRLSLNLVWPQSEKGMLHIGIKIC